jgi:multiple sugar transport system substrate-binding protein
MRRAHHFTLAFASALAFLFGPADFAEAQTLNLYQRGYVAGGEGAATTLTDAAVAAFQSRHPGIEINVVGLPWSREGDLKLRAVLLNRRKIDIFRVAHDELAGFIPTKGTLLSPIDPHLTPEDRADIGPGALDALTYDGRVMAWPLWSTAIALIANADILAERGIAAPEGRPWTWEEFIGILQRATFNRVDGARVHGFTAAARPPLFEWSPLLLAHTGPLFPDGRADPLAPEIMLAPGLAGALAAVSRLRTFGVVPPSFGTDDQVAAQTAFLDGRVAFITSTPGFIRTLAARDFPYRILPPPKGAWGHPITTGALGCFAVVDHPEDPARTAAAHAFAKYLTSAEIAGDVPGWYLAPPVRASATSFAEDPAYSGLMDVVRTSVYMTPPGGPAFVGSTLIPKFQAAIIGAQSPESAIEDVRAAFRRRALY